MNRLVIIGAGGHGKVVADIALKNKYTDIVFVDDHVKGLCMGFPIAGTVAGLKTFDDGKTDFVIGIGNNAVRKLIAEQNSVNWVSLIHPAASIATQVTVGSGTVIMACAVVNPCTSIGSHCIINSGAVVEHDNVLADFVHISPNAVLGGTVRLGEGTHIGIGATVKNNIHVCENCVIGAGAVVIKDITTSGVYVGIPARKLNK